MISPAERAALEALRFNPGADPGRHLAAVAYDVPEQHERAVNDILYDVNTARCGTVRWHPFTVGLGPAESNLRTSSPSHPSPIHCGLDRVR